MKTRGLSINKLSEELGADRRTMRAALQGVKPCGTRRGSPIWRLVDAAKALEARRTARDADGLLRARNLLLHNERLELQIAATRRDMVPASSLPGWAAQLREHVVASLAPLRSVAAQVVHLSVPDAETKLKEVEDQILQRLHSVPKQEAALV